MDQNQSSVHPHLPAGFGLDLTRDPAAPPLVSARLSEPDLGDMILPAPAEPEPAPQESPPLPPQPHDGFTPERRRIFLAALAATGVVTDACRAARISRVTAYNARNEGGAFALAWNAALLLARGPLADEVYSRAMCGVIDRVYRNGELVAERHRYDNRLAMAVLTRLDRQADGMGEGAAEARAIGAHWEEALALVEAGGDRLDSLLAPPDAAPPVRPEADCEAGEADTNGMCKDCKAAAGADGPAPHAPFDGSEVWEDNDGIWWTSFPPPPGFDGTEGSSGGFFYRRTLTAAEQDVIDADLAAERAEEDNRRDRYFGFTPVAAGDDRPGPSVPGAEAAGCDAADDAADLEAWLRTALDDRVSKIGEAND